MSKQVVGITFGDSTGIGPELVVKSLSHLEVKELAKWIIIGDHRVLKQAEEITGLTLNVNMISKVEDSKQDGLIDFIDLENISPNEYKLGELSPQSGKVSGDTLSYAIDKAKEGLIDGIMYAPLNKEALQKGGHKFKDELHFFADLFNYENGFGEINTMDGLWVTRLTSHIPLNEVSKEITYEKVKEKIKFAHDNLEAAGIKDPKIYVASFNPHSGEGGLLGTEEVEIISPAVQSAKEEGYNVFGPYPADTIFLRREKDKFDCLLAMYHDQAQIGIKLLGFNKGVTMSAGLPKILTTPAHGTAFDIAGKGIANEGATIEALKMAVKISSFRTQK